MKHSLRFLKRNFKLAEKQIKFSTVVFDGELKRRHYNYYANLEDRSYYDYLREESARSIVDRIDDINKTFPLAVELGNQNNVLSDLILTSPCIKGSDGCVGGIKNLVKCRRDYVPDIISNNQSKITPLINTETFLYDEEDLPFNENTIDIVVSSLNLHWVNDLPSTLSQVKTILKPDGVFIASMLGGSTLKELSSSFYLAELERKGGFSPHTSPLTKPSDVAGLMQSAGFSIPTIDKDVIRISYPDAFSLMEHLFNMGEGNASLKRRYAVGRDTFLAMAALYQELYGLEDGSVEATFEIIYLIGWCPDASQPKACTRGSAETSLKDVL